MTYGTNICTRKGGGNMREIKFRAWWGEEMFYSPMKEGKYAPDIFDDIYIKPDGSIFDFNSYTEINGGILEENNSGIILMQFTGLKDRNGKEIYEGDILSNKDTDGNMVVNWCPISAGFCLDKKGWMFSHYFKEAVDANQCEVIGNIYEDLELLKG